MMTTPVPKPGSDECVGLRERVVIGFRELEPRLREMIQKQISPRLKGKVDVDDILQDALCQLLKSIKTKPPGSDAELRAWIFKKTCSRWLDELRKWNTLTRKVAREEASPHNSELTSVGELGAATNLGFMEALEEIRSILAPVDFAIVEARIVENLSFSKIAERHGLNEKWVSRRFVKSISEIKKFVASPYSTVS